MLESVAQGNLYRVILSIFLLYFMSHSYLDIVLSVFIIRRCVIPTNVVENIVNLEVLDNALSGSCYTINTE
jgi:hypothetical protein